MENVCAKKGNQSQKLLETLLGGRKTLCSLKGWGEAFCWDVAQLERFLERKDR